MASLRDRTSDALSELRYRFRAVFRRRVMERELSEELHFHLEHEAQKLEAAGMSPADAMRQARLAFGGVERIKDDTRDQSGVSWFENFRADVRYALRGVRARPAFAAAVAVTLGLGIGANVAMFGIIDQLLLRTPTYLRDADRVHRLYLTTFDGDRDVTEGTTEYARYLDFKRYARTLDAVAVVAQRSVAIGVGDVERELPISIVSGNYWQFFDAKPAAGRFFTEREDSIPTGSPVVVLSYAFWQARYGGSPDVIGQPIEIGPILCTVIGVAPAGFIGIADDGAPAAFIPATLFAYARMASVGRQAEYYTKYNWGWLSVMIRRKPGISIDAVNADLTNAYRLSWENERSISRGAVPADVAKPRAAAGPIVNERGPNASPVARMVVWIGGVAAIVLLIACANVANLLLARALARRREIALRLALGASRARLTTQLLTETLVLGTLGGVVGIGVAQWGGAILRSLFLPEDMGADVVRDVRTLMFAGVATVVVGLLVGVVPAFQAGRRQLAPAIASDARDTAFQRSKARTFLLVLQGAFSVLLLVGAGLFVRSLHNVRSLRLGFDVDRLLYIHPNQRGLRLDRQEVAQLARRLVAEAKSMPEVASAARGISVPFFSTEGLGFFVPGVDSMIRGRGYTVQMASSDYFETMGTRVLRGRGILESDRADAPLVAVVSEGMAEALWRGQDPIGKCIMLDSRSAPCRTVVGVVENIQQNSLTETQKLQFYLSIDQMRPDEAILFVRTRGDAANAVEQVRRRLQPLMPGASYVLVASMRDILDPRQRAWQVGATMFVAFGGLALVLAAVGLYSVIAYGVAQRTREIGVRIALGAGVGDVVRLVIAEGMRFAGSGIVLGAAMALWASKWIGPMLFSVSARDPGVYAVVALVLLVAAVLASAIPSLRAARVDPNVALKTD
jgi:predicted permease